MPHDYNSKGAELPDSGFTIPEGEYALEIIKAKEGTSKKAGDYQVTCDLKVIDGDHEKFEVRYHRVTFQDPAVSPKGAGMSIHFLKTIGEPWEGKFKITPANWVGKKLRAYLVEDDYQGFRSMKIKWIAPNEAPASAGQEVEEVPF